MARKAAAEGKILASVLPRFAGMMARQCGHHTFGKELSGYAAAYGYGIMHSDEDLEKYQLAAEFGKLRQILAAEKDDVVFIVAGAAPKDAMLAVLGRAAQCLVGVPEETRVADDEGSNYTRPLPGKERMYPETDIQPVRITRKLLDSIETPVTLEEKEKGLKEVMSAALAEQLVRSQELQLFERLRENYTIEPVVIATTLLSTMKEMRRKGLETEKITEHVLGDLFLLIEQGKLAKDSLHQALEMKCQGKPLKSIVSSMQTLTEGELRRIVRETVGVSAGKSESAVMGAVMQKVRGRADGAAVMKIIREEMK
jgi:glutamyl-tRNA(Gln) amidotransferase subunit E